MNNIDLVKQIYGCFGKGDTQGVLDMLTDDVDWIIPVIQNYPPSGTHHGKQAVIDFFGSLGKFVDIISFEPENFFSDGDTVFVKGSYEFKAKSTGNLISCDWVEVFTFDKGKIKSYEEYTDTAAFQNAFAK